MNRRLSWCCAALVLVSCVQVDLRYEPLRQRERFAEIEEGVTTRSDVLHLVGPPEEFRIPPVIGFGRTSSPQRRQVIEGGDVFGRDRFTYISEHRRVGTFGILPGFAELLLWTRRRTTEERWMIHFDENDVVSSVSHVDEDEE